jgi:hypothetical protein
MIRRSVGSIRSVDFIRSIVELHFVGTSGGCDDRAITRVSRCFKQW